MTATDALHSLGPDGLTALLVRRPELLSPRPPRSLAELAARIAHPGVLRCALARLDLPTVQVTQVLAALGDDTDRSRLDALLGVAPGTGHATGGPTPAAVDRALDELRAEWLLHDGPQRLRLFPTVHQLWDRPLGFGPDVATLASARTADELRVVLHTLGEKPPPRKADMIRRLAEVIDDADRVRSIAAAAPTEIADALVEVAHGRVTLEYYGWYSPRFSRATTRREQPIEWAFARFLLVRDGWGEALTMPAEVALALRGPGWTAPFTPDQPAVDHVEVPAQALSRAAVAAAATALRLVTAVVNTSGTRPLPLLKSGAVGVRELRRLADTHGCAVREVRLSLALAHALDLIDTGDQGAVPTRRFDTWQALPAARRYADLALAWHTLPDLPFATPDAAWSPAAARADAAARAAVLAALGRQPNRAPASPAAFVALVHWTSPFSLPPPAPGDDPWTDRTTTVLATLDEAAWLGLTGAGALSPAGTAVLTGADPAGAVAGSLGSAHTTARLQADLTAVVLGEAAPELAATLDRLADRESRSTAGVWRFSPSSVRRGFDTGLDAGAVLAQLADLAEGEIPQPLEYLVHDVARRHGRLRGAPVACYLRSDDPTLLAELVADRALRRLSLRRIAPTVVVGTRPLGETLDALRAAGHAPVEESPDGATLAVRERRHRADSAADADPASDPASDPQRRLESGPDLAAVVTGLLSDPLRRTGLLADIGTTVIDISDDLPDTLPLR